MNRQPSEDRGHLVTESANPRADALESMSALEAVDLFRREDAAVLQALEGAREDLARMIEIATEKLGSGGRLVYVGAGTSGRLGVLDASECPPTFGVAPDMVQAIIAGGERAVRHPAEGAEDDADQGGRDVDALEIGEHDFVVGIAAGGTTPFVHGALQRARERGAATGFLTCVPRSQVSDDYDVSARLLVGPEVLAGSSRLKAGTVTKLALNTLTTVTMSRLGKTHRGRMVDVDTHTNAKLVDRGVRLIAEFAEVDRERALELLRAAEGHVKTAIAMEWLKTDPEAARRRLKEVGGVLARIEKP
ncbi:N-acetylmuramic acid 6-phosphate etherase [Planctomycetes bacterium Poly30]|uniref:N-acetylmuramic acid 6-phosphate etherase n=1 Tax=Saltatorellus ferox TaxID=2528018 RepID=A0A518EW60_9BACT|nr:N-acetylmuramic acid 6-phosphate etherase [Planctomycetes bacterium Poly30]